MIVLQNGDLSNTKIQRLMKNAWIEKLMSVLKSKVRYELRLMKPIFRIWKSVDSYQIGNRLAIIAIDITRDTEIDKCLKRCPHKRMSISCGRDLNQLVPVTRKYHSVCMMEPHHDKFTLSTCDNRMQR